MFVCKCGRDEALGVRVRGTSHNKRLPLTLDHVTSPKPGAEEVASGAFLEKPYRSQGFGRNGVQVPLLPTSRTTSNRSSWTCQEVGGVEDNFKKNQLTTTHSHSKRPRAARAATGLASRRTAGRP